MSAIIVLLAACAVSLIAYPLIVLGVSASPHAFRNLAQPANMSALRLSLFTAALASVIATVCGTALGYYLALRHGYGASVLRALVLVPLVLPPVVSGVALLHAYGRSGPLGPLLEHVGVRIVFSTQAVILAQVFVSLPFVVLTLESAFRSRGLDQERTAASLGASAWLVLARITLPRYAPVIALGALLAFARSLGEFGATLTFAGSLEGVSRTVPLQIYLLRESDMDAAIALSLSLALFSLLIVTLAYARPRRTSRDGRTRLDGSGA